MAQKQRRAHGPAFTVLVGHHAYGSDPSHNNPIYQAPPVLRRAVTFQAIDTNGNGAVHATHVNGLLAGAKAPKTADFTVADNDFTTGPVILTLGKYTLTSMVDYAIAGSAALTAIEIAAAIDALPGFTASAVGVIVSVLYGLAPADEVDFSVLHLGTIANFTLLTPDSGVMGNGAPAITAPALT
jgi:hypothetical protein